MCEILHKSSKKNVHSFLEEQFYKNMRLKFGPKNIRTW